MPCSERLAFCREIITSSNEVSDAPVEKDWALAWALLDQAIAPIQLVGAALVLGTVMWLGLRKR